MAKRVAKKAAKKRPRPGPTSSSAWKKKILSRIASDVRRARSRTSPRGLDNYYKDGGGVYGKGSFGKSERPRARKKT